MDYEKAEQINDTYRNIQGSIFTNEFMEMLNAGLPQDHTFEDGKKISKEEYMDRFTKILKRFTSPPSVTEKSTKSLLTRAYEDNLILKNEFLPLFDNKVDPELLKSFKLIADLNLDVLKEQIEKGNESKDTKTQPA